MMGFSVRIPDVVVGESEKIRKYKIGHRRAIGVASCLLLVIYGSAVVGVHGSDSSSPIKPSSVTSKGKPHAHHDIASSLAEALPDSSQQQQPQQPSLGPNLPPPKGKMDPIARASASFFAESALVDKETGRVYWQGGGSSEVLSASLNPLLGATGLKHVRATILTALLFMAALSSFAVWMKDTFLTCNQQIMHGGSVEVIPCVPSTVQKVALLLAQLTVLRLPQFSKRVLGILIALYLLESYRCSTRTYLAHALSTSNEVEEYIEQLRSVRPVISWKVRCFHFERRKWLAAIFLIDMVRWVRKQCATLDKSLMLDPQSISGTAGEQKQNNPSTSSFFTKKVVTHTSERKYEFNGCKDSTIAGIWKRAESSTHTYGTTAPPFTKMTLSKMIVFSDGKARENYFSQQSDFVTSEGQRDEYSEFSTNIQVDKFKRRMLAVRPVEGVPSTQLFRLHLFWLFTLMGLTVPFRIWFSRHCDELRVTVVKETSMMTEPPSNWLASSLTWKNKSNHNHLKVENFRQHMQNMALYQKEKKNNLLELIKPNQGDSIENTPNKIEGMSPGDVDQTKTMPKQPISGLESLTQIEPDDLPANIIGEAKPNQAQSSQPSRQPENE